jgi:hypothetical protein
MVTIGQAAVGLGIAGQMRPDTAEKTALPPGVYLPSRDGLSHALMSAERFHPIPPGCPTDYNRPRNGGFEPLFFSQPDFAVILRMTQLLLGETSEDRADANAELSEEVAEWIDLRVSSATATREAALRVAPQYRALAQAYDSEQMKQLEKSDATKICREGLEWVAGAAQSRHGRQFLMLQTEEQISVLDSISDERADVHDENAGTSFFTYLKGEVIRGFYTSQKGLQELDYKGNAFYARSPGCGGG